MKFALRQETTLAILKAMPDDFVVTYGAATCWWNVPQLTSRSFTVNRDRSGLPCDPRGGLLLQGELGKFLAAAEANPAHYGKHGLNAFIAAFEGNVTTRDGRSTCFESWRQYNELIDQAAATKGATP